MWALSDLDTLRVLSTRNFDAYLFGPLAVVYLAGMLLALIFRPERITRKLQFRLSLACFALFLLVPCVDDLEMLILAMSTPEQLQAKVAGKRLEGRPFIDLIEQVLLTGAILCGIGSFGRPRSPDG
jgi:hypothetical protein